MRPNRPLLAAVVAATCLMSGQAAAQSLDDIIGMNLKSKGGLEKIRATSTVKMTGQVSAKDDPAGESMTAATTMMAKRPNMMRREQVVNGERMVSAFDGTTLWMSRGEMPPQQAPGPQAAYARQDAEFDSVFVDYKAKGHAIALVGREKRGGADVFHLKVTKKGGPPQDYYLDASTGLEQAISMTLQGGPTPMVVVTELGDYREVDGRMMPFSIRQRVNGVVSASTKIDTVEFNVPIGDETFRMPRGK